MRIILLAALFVSTSAFATKDHGSQALEVVNKNNNTAVSGSKSSSKSGSTSGAENVLNQGGVKVPHQAPSFGIGTMFPTAPCQGTKGGGFSVPWGGAALSGSHTLKECELRETIRTVIHMQDAGVEVGNTAKELLCMTEHGSKTTLCGAKKEVKEETTIVNDAKFEDMLPWNWNSRR